MGNISIGLAFVMFVNVLLFLGQATVIALNDETPIEYWHYDGTLLEMYDSNNDPNNPLLDTSNVESNFPQGEGTIQINDGNIFTDLFSSIKTWIEDNTGLTYAKAIVSAPYNALIGISFLPQPFIFAVGTLWYITTVFLIIGFFWGRD